MPCLHKRTLGKIYLIYRPPWQIWLTSSCREASTAEESKLLCQTHQSTSDEHVLSIPDYIALTITCYFGQVQIQYIKNLRVFKSLTILLPYKIFFKFEDSIRSMDNSSRSCRFGLISFTFGRI